jgi:hypothetical protein
MRHGTEPLRRIDSDSHCRYWSRVHDGPSPVRDWKVVIDTGTLRAPVPAARGNDRRSDRLERVSAAHRYSTSSIV